MFIKKRKNEKHLVLIPVFFSCLQIKKQHIFFIIGFLLFLSCTRNIQQYSKKPPSDPDRTMYNVPSPSVQPSREEGGLSIYQKPELSEEQRDIQIRQNSLVPIDYQTGSAGNISIDTIYEEASDTLNFERINTFNGAHHYAEGMSVLWRKDAPYIPITIALSETYQGSMDFGLGLGENRYRKIGQSFADQFTPGKSINKDEKALSFLRALYQYLENTDEDCLVSKKCQFGLNDNIILFSLPKMAFIFGNNERRKLIQISIIRRNKPGCFGQVFDLLRTEFFCGYSEDDSPIVLNFGEFYHKNVKKSGINPDIPIIYFDDYLSHKTDSALIGWERNNFEKKLEKIPDDSVLSYVGFIGKYAKPFVLDRSLIRVKLQPDNNVLLSLDRIRTKDMMSIEETLKQLWQQLPEDTFYLGNNLPKVRGNRILQQNLIKAFFDLLEENYKSFYNVEKVYTGFYGSYNDKQVSTSSGTMFISFRGDFNPPLNFDIDIERTNGSLILTVSSLVNDFAKHLIENQRPLDLSQKVTGVSGFKLGDKIYLRNKNIGDNTAVMAYITGGGKVLKALGVYGSETDMAVVYENGRDKDINFQKGEIIATDQVKFVINPTFAVKIIDGQSYDEYEINGIFLNGHHFFETINSLCSIEGFQVEMGMYDRSFTQQLIQKVSQAASGLSLPLTVDGTSQPTEGAEPVKKSQSKKRQSVCHYISPQDPLFSSLKRDYFFPDHNLVLAFRNRQLYSLRIYKQPSDFSENKGGLRER